MPARQRLTPDERGRALGWLDNGLSEREVARRLQRSHSVVQRLRERFRTTGSTAERPRSGRPRTTTRRQDRYLVNAALRDRSCNATVLRTVLRNATNANICTQTVRNRLHENNLRARRPAVRSRLTPAHRVRRLAWARQHLGWTRQQWAAVLFTDESRFTISFHDGRNRVWRRRGERFQDATIQEHDRYGGGSVMVWGGMSLRSRTVLHRINGNLNGARYVNEVLRPIAVPAVQALGPGAVYQDDNAPAHRARVATDFLTNQNVNRMNWPALSPDLNPIEHLWDELGRRIHANYPPPRNVNYLFRNLNQEWN